MKEADGNASRWIEFMHELADEAGRILLSHFSSLEEGEFSKKSRLDPVTVADHEVERRLVEMITERFPSHGILAEEETDLSREAEYLWVMDPLDGTNNYLHTIPMFCVSIALLHRGRTVAAMVDAPLMKERFWAAAGGGAFLNGEPIRCSSWSEFEDCVVCTGFADLKRYGSHLNLVTFYELSWQVSGMRRLGAAALDLCWLACGRLDGWWEYSLNPWDIAAGALIAEEAGCVVRNIGSDSFDPFDGDIVAANPDFFEKFYERILRIRDAAGSLLSRIGEASSIQRRFVEERGWERYHTPGNVACALTVEAAELLEIFQWKNRDEQTSLDERTRARIADECADVLAYLLSMCHVCSIDLMAAFKRKMKENARKYPKEGEFDF